MKVFMSWSGNKSRDVAEYLSEWLEDVIQELKPWVSTHNIDRGAMWLEEISKQLQDTYVGIICLTQENKNRPWVLFEAGALSKGLPTSRICTVLIDLQKSDVEGPWQGFNHTSVNQNEMWELIRTLNKALGLNALNETTLDRVFKINWPRFEERFNTILKDHTDRQIGAQAPSSRTPESMIKEILENTRQLMRTQSSEVRGSRRLISGKEARMELLDQRTASSEMILSGLSEEATYWYRKGSFVQDGEFVGKFVIGATSPRSHRVRAEIRGAVSSDWGVDTPIIYLDDPIDSPVFDES